MRFMRALLLSSSLLAPRGMAAAVVLCAAAGCAASPAVVAARKPDYKALAREIESARKANDLSDGDVEDIAEAIAEGEIERAKGLEGEQLLLSFAACAEQVEDELEDRFEKGDEIGAVAASILLSSGVVDSDEYEDFAIDADPRPSYRALGARGLIDEEHFVLRRKLFLDLDERVRVNALKAALTATSKEDFDALLEAARLDPNPAARSAAVRALGRVGGERVVVALKDLWLRADGRLRESIVDGFMAFGTFEAGGLGQLVKAAEAGGEGSIAAAVALARIVIQEAPEKAARESARGVLVRAILVGTREERTYAMLMAPSTGADGVVLDALRKAAEDSDPGIQLIALGRLAHEGKPDEQKSAINKLLEIAKSDDPEANRAMSELASLKDKRVTPLLDKELGSKNAFARGYAARNLVLMGELQRAARALADSDAYVRVTAACEILRSE